MFHHAFGSGGFNIVADPEGIVHKEKHPRDDVFDQGLGAEGEDVGGQEAEDGAGD